jgi:hypothetical protein
VLTFCHNLQILVNDELILLQTESVMRGGN